MEVAMSRRRTWGVPEKSHEYIVAGNGVIVTFPPGVGILSCDEGHFRGRRFVPGRRLNGDETHQGRQVRLPMGALAVQRVKVYSFK